MKTRLLILLCAFVPSLLLAANVTFNLSDILQTTQPLQRKTVVLVPQSTPRTNATNVIVISEPRYFNLGTNASFVATNLVYGNYLVNVWALNSTSQFRILVPNTNGALYASDLLVTSNSVPSDAAGYTQTAANGRFVLRNSGWASNLVVTNLTLPVGAVDGYVWTASGGAGAGVWAEATGGGGGGLSTVRTNGTSISGAATSLNLVEGTNVVFRATNSAGAVTVQINAVAGDVSTAQLNAASNAAIATAAQQVGTNFSATNLFTRGLTNTGNITNTGTVSIGGALDVGGHAELRNSASVYTELNVFGDINQVTAGGYTTLLGPSTINGALSASTNATIAGTNDARWLKLSLLATGSVLRLDANKLASVDDALTWASDRLNESTNRIEWRVVPTDNLSNILATVPNNTTIKLAPGTYTAPASILNSNYNRSTTYIGLFMGDKTNVTIEGSGIESTIISARASLGTMLYLSNCSGLTIRGVKMEGYTNHNFTMLPGYSPITTNQGAYLWALIEYYQCEKLTFENMWVDGSTDHGIWDRGVNDANQYPASTVCSTNQILFEDMLLTDIGSFRTNSTSPTTGFAVDGTALGPTTATIRRVRVHNSLRAFEPYNENAADGYVFTGTTIEDFEVRNIADSGFVLYGTTTNGHWGTVRRGRIENDSTFSWHGTNYGFNSLTDHGGYGLFLASGRGWKIHDIEVVGTFIAGAYIGNDTTPVDDFDLQNITFRNIDSGGSDLGVGMYVGSFGTTAADASSVRRLRLANIEANFCMNGGINVFGGRDIVIEGFRSHNPSRYPNPPGIKVGRNGVTAAGITNITVRGSRQVSAGLSAWGIAIENNVYSANVYDNEAHGFTIAPLTNQSASAAVNLPEVNLRVTNSIASSLFTGSRFVETNGFNASAKHGWLSTNLQWRLVKMGTLTNVVDVSAAAYYPSNNSFFTVHNNNSGRITEWTLDGVFLRNINGSGSGLTDVEGIVYMGGNKFAIVEEDVNNIYVISITNNAAGSTWTTNNSEMFELPVSIGVDASGSGVEGIAYDWDRKLWWIAKEKNPAQLIIVTNDAAGVWYTNNWFTTAQMQTFTNAANTDFSDLFLDRENQILWVAQDEGGTQTDRVIGISLYTSNIVSIINATNFGQLEGVSITPDGFAILAGEANQFAIYEPVIGGLNSGISWNNFVISTNTPAVPSFNYGMSVGRFGVYLTNWFATNITLDFPVIEAQSETNLQFSLAWAANDYEVTVTPSAYLAGMFYSGQPSNGVVYVRGHNYSTTTKDPASGGFRVVVKGWR